MDMERMKLSELTFDKVKGLTMHEDASDCQREINSENALNEARESLMRMYGDVDIVIDESKDWFDKVHIDDERWQEAHTNYCDAKQAWCDKYGCD